ncbi:uncharacterized protein LOC103501556 [Cucumis melo]|uniref:Uncharacterized protein LOC103501556 n=1 Tax=Cucumis melo TaxID=3656 RepID=A0A1S3CJL1_CUCME|nr:uncharacterized protein LOC103501556 [Cucumis melo]
MLLRATISNTKKFFRKTIWNFKSFFSNTYHRLPKAPPPFPAVVSEMDKDSTFHFISPHEEVQNGSFMKNNTPNAAVHLSTSTMGESQMERVEKNEDRMKIGGTHQRKMQENLEYCRWKRRMCLVAKNMKELEKLDARNVDHTLDIEEILHYYSRLTSPTFLEMVDKFVVDIFAEFSAISSSQPTQLTRIQ